MRKSVPRRILDVIAPGEELTSLQISARCGEVVTPAVALTEYRGKWKDVSSTSILGQIRKGKASIIATHLSRMAARGGIMRRRVDGRYLYRRA